MNFKTAHSFEERKKEAERIIIKFPDRVPVILQKSKDAKNLPELSKIKYLVPQDMSVGMFLYTIRKRISLAPTTALFLFIDNNSAISIAPTADLIGKVFVENKNEDGFLYMVLTSENTFG